MSILGVGNALVDALVLLEDDSLLSDLQLPKGSMTLIDHQKYTQITNILQNNRVSYVAGGSVANSIVGLGALDIPVGFLGNVAQDSFGKIFQDSFLSIGVNPHLNFDDGNTGIATTFISRDGERTFATYLGVASNIDTAVLTKKILSQYKIFYIEGYLVHNHKLFQNLIQLGKAAGLDIALDLASYNVVSENKAFLEEIIPHNVNILFTNEQEAESLTNLSPQEAVKKIATWVDIAVVKIGAKGSLIQKDLDLHVIDAFPVQECIDTTGAGDLYAAGFLYGLVKNLPLSICGKLGSLLASEVIKYVGPKIPLHEWEVVRQQVQNIENNIK